MEEQRSTIAFTMHQERSKHLQVHTVTLLTEALHVIAAWSSLASLLVVVEKQHATMLLKAYKGHTLA